MDGFHDVPSLEWLPLLPEQRLILRCEPRAEHHQSEGDKIRISGHLTENHKRQRCTDKGATA